VSYYRLYSIDGLTGHITDVSHFNAYSDASAITLVKPDILGVSRELWNRGRKVADFEPRILPAIKLGLIGALVNPSRGWRWNPLESHCQLLD